ncbi:MAG: hypothetical protein SW833_08170 [Cyanobacteriota bacterium]|nr:hypothetical protein [Cyanobacteriota bacterium]
MKIGKLTTKPSASERSAIASGLGIANFIQDRQAVENELNAIATSSESLRIVNERSRAPISFASDIIL